MKKNLRSFALAATVTSIFGGAPAQAQTGAIEQLRQDTIELKEKFLGKLDNVLEKEGTAADRIKAGPLRMTLDIACGTFVEAMKSKIDFIQGCLYAVREGADKFNVSNLLNAEEFTDLFDRYRDLRNIPDASSQQPEQTNAQNYEIIVKERYAEDVASYLSNACANGFSPPVEERKNCNQATMTAPFTIGRDAAKVFEERGAPEAAQKVRDACNDPMQYAQTALFVGDIKPRAAFSTAVTCLETVIRTGEQDLGVRFNPQAVNTALNHTYRMMGERPLTMQELNR